MITWLKNRRRNRDNQSEPRHRAPKRLGALAIGLGLLAAVVLSVALTVTNGHKKTLVRSADSASQVAAEGVGNIPADLFTQRGIYLGPPGQTPTAASGYSIATPTPTTPSQSSSASSPATTGLSGEQAAVQGDPADGHAQVTATQALQTATAQAAGFVGSTTTETPVLVQYVDAPAGVVATAWAVPLSGTVDLSAGPAPSGTASPATNVGGPEAATAVVFVDAVTGKVISEQGSLPLSSPDWLATRRGPNSHEEGPPPSACCHKH
jgi:hypothetical protein